MRSLIALTAGISLVLVGCGRKDSSLDVPTVTEPIGCILSATVTPAAATLHIGDTLTFRASGGPGCAPGTPQFHWRWLSSDTAIAIVDSATGLVRAKKLGAATIISVAIEESGVRAAGVATVTP